VQIDLSLLCELRELQTKNSDSVYQIARPTGFTMGAAIELAVLVGRFSPPIRDVIKTWSESTPFLQHAISTYISGTPPLIKDLWVPQYLEVFPVRGVNWKNDPAYHPFESRFAKSARNAGFGRVAEALAGALREMTDNVVEHSGYSSKGSVAGLVGYHVIDGHAAFAVCDSGRGALESLQENPQWHSLKSSQEALLAIAKRGASRRPGLGEGEGFKSVLQSIANLNGSVEFHSGNGRVRIIGTPSGREAKSRFIGFMPGFQISVTCSLKGEPGERIF